MAAPLKYIKCSLLVEYPCPTTGYTRGKKNTMVRFTTEEIELFRDVFKQHGISGDDTADTAGFDELIAELEQTCPPEMVEQILGSLDSEAGDINFEHLLELASHKQPFARSSKRLKLCHTTTKVSKIRYTCTLFDDIAADSN
eukprot:TRINITY_DN16289_c0_g1_i1.p1 TRINITY_DN16289_c0_g1~~TRINITY_DN16289_c0_g1_i1.p1  ORF type:complete len:142 (+),score=24.51 TRINITY_DN16289_c0_g1_i1:2-427(+)